MSLKDPEGVSDGSDSSETHLLQAPHDHTQQPVSMTSTDSPLHLKRRSSAENGETDLTSTTDDDGSHGHYSARYAAGGNGASRTLSFIQKFDLEYMSPIFGGPKPNQKVIVALSIHDPSCMYN